MDDNKREHKRTPLKVQLRIDHPVHGQMLVTTRDISDSGVFVVIDEAQSLLQIGEVVSGQVQGLPIPAPIVQMQVVRFEPSGVALIFRRED
ncbi:PilZ domain-containing protein [Pseudomonas sp. ML96]|uniref:PilZ domain-containing protein n=1 Tax=Pseudomonadaceae TaxID=135621 RepID=UPI0005BC3A1A|nr:PilZ domain-containing protein [Pseudomonas sp. ML96]